MKIYFNLELDSYSNMKGENSIMIRCTQNRKHKRINTGIQIKSELWNRKLREVSKRHPLSKEYNASIKKQSLFIEKLYLDMLRENEDVTLEYLINRLQKPKSSNFFDFAVEHKLNQFRAKNKLGTLRRYEAVLNKLKEFTGKQLTINQIDYSLLKGFEAHLIEKKMNGKDTVSSNLSVIRTVLNEAVKHGLYEKRNPFDSISLKYTDNTKQKLTIEELKAFNNVTLPNIPSLLLARDFFMACFFAAGCRGGDMVLMKWENLKMGMFDYTQQKTGKRMLLPILPELQVIFNQYKNNPKFIFPLLNEHDKVNEIIVNSKLTYINKYLKEVCKYAGIFKNISTHCARHTFSDISLSLNENDIFSLKDVLGHSSVKTTEGYLNGRNYSKAGEYLKSITKLLNS